MICYKAWKMIDLTKERLKDWLMALLIAGCSDAEMTVDMSYLQGGLMTFISLLLPRRNENGHETLAS